MNLEDIMLSETGHTQKDKYCLIPLRLKKSEGDGEGNKKGKKEKAKKKEREGPS